MCMPADAKLKGELAKGTKKKTKTKTMTKTIIEFPPSVKFILEEAPPLFKAVNDEDIHTIVGLFRRNKPILREVAANLAIPGSFVSVLAFAVLGKKEKALDKIFEIFKFNLCKVADYPEQACTAFYIAADKGYHKILRKFIDNSPGIASLTTATLTAGTPALLSAATEGHAQCVEVLLDAKESIEQLDRFGRTALYLAAANGKTETVRLLLERGAIVNAAVKPIELAGLEQGQTPLMAACIGKSLDCVELLLASKADVNAVSASGSSASIIAASLGETVILQQLIEHKADCDHHRNDGRTALMYAAVNDDCETIKVLLAKKDLSAKIANMTAVNNEGLDAAQLAIKYNKKAALSCLLVAGYPLTVESRSQDENPYKRTTPLMFAAFDGNVDAIQVLLDAKANIGAVVYKNDIPVTALVYALRNKDNLQFLLDKDPNQQLSNAIHQAVYSNLIEVLRLLLDHSKKYQSSNFGFHVIRAYSTATIENKVSGLQYLLSEPTFADRVECHLENSLFNAINDGFVEIAQTLLKHRPALIQIKNNQGYTPLLAAIDLDNVDSLKALIEAKADLEESLPNGQNALMLAKERKREKILEILLKAKLESGLQSTIQSLSNSLLQSKQLPVFLGIFCQKLAENIECFDNDNTFSFSFGEKRLSIKLDRLVEISIEVFKAQFSKSKKNYSLKDFPAVIDEALLTIEKKEKREHEKLKESLKVQANDFVADLNYDNYIQFSADHNQSHEQEFSDLAATIESLTVNIQYELDNSDAFRSSSDFKSATFRNTSLGGKEKDLQAQQDQFEAQFKEFKNLKASFLARLQGGSENNGLEKLQNSIHQQLLEVCIQLRLEFLQKGMETAIALKSKLIKEKIDPLLAQYKKLWNEGVDIAAKLKDLHNNLCEARKLEVKAKQQFDILCLETDALDEQIHQRRISIEKENKKAEELRRKQENNKLQQAETDKKRKADLQIRKAEQVAYWQEKMELQAKIKKDNADDTKYSSEDLQARKNSSTNALIKGKDTPVMTPSFKCPAPLKLNKKDIQAFMLSRDDFIIPVRAVMEALSAKKPSAPKQSYFYSYLLMGASARIMELLSCFPEGLLPFLPDDAIQFRDVIWHRENLQDFSFQEAVKLTECLLDVCNEFLAESVGLVDTKKLSEKLAKNPIFFKIIQEDSDGVRSKDSYEKQFQRESEYLTLMKKFEINPAILRMMRDILNGRQGACAARLRDFYRLAFEQNEVKYYPALRKGRNIRHFDNSGLVDLLNSQSNSEKSSDISDISDIRDVKEGHKPAVQEARRYSPTSLALSTSLKPTMGSADRKQLVDNLVDNKEKKADNKAGPSDKAGSSDSTVLVGSTPPVGYLPRYQHQQSRSSQTAGNGNQTAVAAKPVVAI